MNNHLERDLRLVYGAYEYLRAHDLSDLSTTSHLLREGNLAYLARRVSDELGELRGAVAGTHGHGGNRRDDVALEAYQSVYWLIVLAVAAGDRYDDLRSHEAPARVDSPAAAPCALPELDARDAGIRRDFMARGFAAIGAACRQAGVPVEDAVRRDLRELRSKDYLAAYWGATDGPATADRRGDASHDGREHER